MLSTPMFPKETNSLLIAERIAETIWVQNANLWLNFLFNEKQCVNVIPASFWNQFAEWYIPRYEVSNPQNEFHARHIRMYVP